MRNPIDPEPLRVFLEDKKIATLEELKQVLHTTSTMTVFRKLCTLDYQSSYSHRGMYYTLQDIPRFDEQGLWSFHSVWFSQYGNLIQTAWELVEKSPDGHTAPELEQRLHVECKAALLKLCQQQRLERQARGGIYIYYSHNAARQRAQQEARAKRQPEIPVFPDSQTQELKAAILLFHSLLDEKQRRLYAGLEAYKLGHGGDEKIAVLLGVDRHTVAKGRQELLGAELSSQRIREVGGGRKLQEKKRRRSLSGSKNF